MESETETTNYKNTSMPPSARLEENRKKEPFSSVAAGSPSVVITGPCSLESAILRFPGWSEHPQTGSSRGSRGMGGPAPLWLPSQGTGPRAVLGTAPRTTRAALSSEAHRAVPTVPRAGLPFSHLTPFSLQISPLPQSQPRSCLLFPDMTSKQPKGSLEVLACWLPVPYGQYPRLLSSSRPRPRAGPPHHWLQDHLPSFLLHSREPAAYEFTPISPVSTSSPFSCLLINQGEPADSSSRAPCSAHCGSLKAPWEQPLRSPSPPSLQVSASRQCAPPCRAAPWGL